LGRGNGKPFVQDQSYYKGIGSHSCVVQKMLASDVAYKERNLVLDYAGVP
jgi:hypothetical protein